MFAVVGCFVVWFVVCFCCSVVLDCVLMWLHCVSFVLVFGFAVWFDLVDLSLIVCCLIKFVLFCLLLFIVCAWLVIGRQAGVFVFYCGLFYLRVFVFVVSVCCLLGLLLIGVAFTFELVCVVRWCLCLLS